MKSDIIIRRAGSSEVEELRKIAVQTCLETFSKVTDEKNMKKYLATAFSIKKLTKEMNDPESEFYFACSNDNVIGFLKVNSGNAQTELQDPAALELERIYVYRKYHGKKVGQMLFDKAIEIARNKKAEYIWLGVWEFNLRAMSFYKKNGFVRFSEHKFIFGDEEATDLMLKLELT